MLRKLFAPLIFLGCVAACGPSQFATHPNIPDPPAPSPSVNKRNDLPLGWNEIKGEGYSFGLPGDFAPTIVGTNDYKLFFSSPQRDFLSVGFNFETTIFADVKEYLRQVVLARFAATNHRVIEIRYNATLDIYAVVSMISIDNNSMNDTISLDFFKQHNKTIYKLACSGKRNNFSTHSPVCFDVAQTLRLQ